MEKWLNPGLEQGEFKVNLAHLVEPASKKMLEESWGPVFENT